MSASTTTTPISARSRELLTDDGVALIHSIGRSDGPGATNPWIRQIHLPGRLLPALSEVLPAIERAGLIVTDIEILRLHYAETLKRWRERFNANRDAIARALRRALLPHVGVLPRGVARRRSATAATWCSRSSWPRRVDAVPLTRDYIGEAEGRPAARPCADPAREAAE